MMGQGTGMSAQIWINKTSRMLNPTGMGNRTGPLREEVTHTFFSSRRRGRGGNNSELSNYPDDTAGVPFCDDFYAPDFDYFDYYRNVFLLEPSVI